MNFELDDIVKTNDIFKINHLLLISSLFFLIPIYVFIKKFVLYRELLSIFEYILVAFILFNIFASLLFWYNGNKHSGFHIVDGIFAKISIVMFIIYILFFKHIPYYMILLFLAVLSLVIYFIYYSNHYSTIQWCSESHIFHHAMFHVSASMGALYAFM
jgi:O-antigen/teichoic acid export membrane protein